MKFQAQSQHIINNWPRLSEAEQEYIGRMHLHYEGEFAKWEGHPKPEEVAHTIHGIVDDEVAALFKRDPGHAKDVQCKKGCSACCRQNVTITQPEAALLLLLEKHDAVAIDWDLVRRQAANPGPRWHKQPVADWACPFLDQGAGTCTVYEHRPAMCRKHFVLSDPKDCDTEHGPEQVLNFVSMEAEVVASAALTVQHAVSMPVQLLLQKAVNARASRQAERAGQA